MSTLEQQVAAEQAAHDEQTDTDFGNKPAGSTDEAAPNGQSPEEGKLFDVPRVQVAIDESDPSVLKIAFSGQVELERGKAGEVDFYNRLTAGKGIDLSVHAHVAGAKRTHRRDSEGNVDAVLETKSLIITDVSLV